jgi:HSP20 family molecular chaperone IbpA
MTFVNEQNDYFQSSRFAANRYSINDYGQGYRTYSYEFDLIGYEPEQITVLLNKQGRLRIRAYRPLCHEFRREYHLGGPNFETRLVRNTIDTHGRLRVDVDVSPRQYDSSPMNNNNNNILKFDLHGYRTKNINVRIDDNGLLKISAQHTDESAGHQLNREYYRQYQLPKHINQNQIRARIDDNQILTIELPESLRKKSSWQPYYGRNYPSDYEQQPYKNCCCLM